MIEQKDIDKLLAARKVVDNYRAVSAVYREKVAISSDSKLSADVAVTKEKYIDREAATKKMHEELIKVGFASYDEFEKFNAQMVMEEYKEVTTFNFLGCKGCSTRKCEQIYGANTCVSQNLKDISAIEDSIRSLILTLLKKSNDGLEKKFADIRICPDGYGFQETRNRTERFDVRWV